MSFAENYIRQVSLLVNVLPIIANETCFALKGGSAINLFYQDLPRLSVDLDLVYLPLDKRATAIDNINNALLRIQGNLQKNGLQAAIAGQATEKKIICSNHETTIKIEPNYTIRGTVCAPIEAPVSPKVLKKFGFAQMKILEFNELYAGKFCAALDRQHPRDLFDIKKFYETQSNLNDKIIQIFIIYLLGHNRPVHELLDCEIQDHQDIFENEFTGMTDEQVDYSKLQDFLLQLKNDLKTHLRPYKKFILDFLALNEGFPNFPISDFQTLPAIQWKVQNLEHLRKSNKQKFMQQQEKLELYLSKQD